MLKRSLLILILFLILPVFASELDSAFAKNDNVFLYMYTPSCRYCKEFLPHYNSLSKKYGNQYEFVKVDASTYNGNKLFREYKGTYVPFVILLNKKTNKERIIHPNCLFEDICTAKALKGFKS